MSTHKALIKKLFKGGKVSRRLALQKKINKELLSECAFCTPLQAFGENFFERKSK